MKNNRSGCSCKKNDKSENDKCEDYKDQQNMIDKYLLLCNSNEIMEISKYKCKLCNKLKAKL